MPKYTVDLTETVYRSASVEIVAESKSAARYLAWDLVRPNDWYEKTGDSDSYVVEVKE